MVLLSLLLALAAQEPPAREPRTEFVLIEAEDHAGCTPDVVRRHDMTWASGRTALIRFPGVERIRWRLAPRGTGASDLWVRHAARGAVRLPWAVDEGDWSVVELEGSGALEGRGAWTWSRLGSVAEGTREVSLGGAPLRLDCLALTAPGSEAPAWPPAHEVAPLPEDVLERLRELPGREPAAWLAWDRGLELPPWLEETRVGLHTRLSLAWIDEPLFEQAEAAAASLGAPALVRHVKSMNGQCYWPSAHGAVHGVVAQRTREGLDPVAAMTRRAHDHGLALVAYYRHQEDRPLAVEHPDWVARDAAGRVVRRANEPALCFHSPFGQVTLERLLELAARGVDGFYLDESHQPLEGCWCEWTRRAFERESGLPLPAAPLLEDPLYRRFLAFTEDSLARELRRWREVLAERHPGTVLLVGTHTQGDLRGPLPTLRLAALAPSAKTELRTGIHAAAPGLGDGASLEARLLLGWALARDGANGRPAHVWVHGLEGPARWRTATAAVVASGCIANLDHPEADLPDPETFAGALALGRELSAPLAGARPFDMVLLHLPERARNARLPDEERAFDEVTGPFVLAWERLLDAHRPARILSDDDLALGLPAGAQLLFLPAPRALEPAQRASVQRFLERGGSVVEADPGALLEAVDGLDLPTLEAPARVRASWFRTTDGTLVLGLANRPGWILDPTSAPPPLVEGARVLLGERELAVPAFAEGIVLRLPG